MKQGGKAQTQGAERHRCRHGSFAADLPPGRPAAGLAGRIVWGWRWFWYIFCKNRFAIAVASLVWLIWRSGSQPRRLAYPCQQAAAANLGFLAVLFIPGLARRRRQRRGSFLPRAAELAAGSAVLAGVLFLLVSAGVEVYSEITAAYSPGSPAVLPWTPVPVDIATPMRSRVLAPTSTEAVVAVNRNPSVSYGTPPYDPGTNLAYGLLWQTVADLHLGPPENPLADLVRDMDGDGVIRVVIKPNMVEYYPDQNGQRCPVYTHPALVRPLVDMAARAGAHEVRVGDGSDGTGAFFTSKLNPMGYTQSYFSQLDALWPNTAVSRVDFQNLARWSWVRLGAQAGGASAYAGSGYTTGQLQKSHDNALYFSATDPHGRPGPGQSNCMGWLAVTDYLLEADVIVDLAKLKVHYLSPNTIVLKNWVGTTMFSTYSMGNLYGCRVSHNAYGATNYEMGFGNDILWRELVDLHRTFLYRRGDMMHTTPQRGYLCVLDAINCGEQYHVPNTPQPWWLQSVLASVDPVAIDAVASRLQRYEFRRVPIVNNAHAASIASSWPIGTADPGRVRVVGGTMIDGTFDHVFLFDTAQDPSKTWPDWNQTTISDVQPPVINSARSEPAGADTWQVTADISGAHAAFYYYGDDGTGAPNVVRLAKSGSTFAALITGHAGNGCLIAQDERFNTTRSDIFNFPAIGVSRTGFVRDVRCGQPLADDSFGVWNAGVGTLDYAIRLEPADVDWLSVSPAAGNSTGEVDPITIAYDWESFVPGIHTATIVVTDPNSSNQAAGIAVTVNVTGYRSDFDGDGDVDLSDFARLQCCLSGPFVPQDDPDCQGVKLDDDPDVDRDDTAIFLNCLSGPNVPAHPCCTQ